MLLKGWHFLRFRRSWILPPWAPMRQCWWGGGAGVLYFVFTVPLCIEFRPGTKHWYDLIPDPAAHCSGKNNLSSLKIIWLGWAGAMLASAGLGWAGLLGGRDYSYSRSWLTSMPGKYAGLVAVSGKLSTDTNFNISCCWVGWWQVSFTSQYSTFCKLLDNDNLTDNSD